MKLSHPRDVSIVKTEDWHYHQVDSIVGDEVRPCGRFNFTILLKAQPEGIVCGYAVDQDIMLGLFFSSSAPKYLSRFVFEEIKKRLSDFKNLWISCSKDEKFGIRFGFAKALGFEVYEETAAFVMMRYRNA